MRLPCHFSTLPAQMTVETFDPLHQRHDGARHVVQRRDVERSGIQQDDVGFLAGGQRAGLVVELQPAGAFDGGKADRIIAESSLG